jgi:hypothetical protein
VTGKPNVAATLEEFTLTEDCKQFIVEHTCGKEQTDPSQQPASQSAHSRKVQLLQQEKQSPPPAVITDDHTQRSLIWVTINHIHLHKSDKDTLLQDEWLNECSSISNQTAASTYNWSNANSCSRKESFTKRIFTDFRF